MAPEGWQISPGNDQQLPLPAANILKFRKIITRGEGSI
ncbi:MAG: hypothetical protein [Olavius algarvensis Delta 4 endosymbiont]|nr:MAG: hypothetical protein [Olavius algarvensis Delta 4 endosymbiont]